MDDLLIREIIEAFETARVEFDEKMPGEFSSHLYDHRAWSNSRSRSRNILTRQLTPVLEKHFADKPSQPQFAVMIGDVAPDNLEDCKLMYKGNLYPITRVKED